MFHNFPALMGDCLHWQPAIGVITMQSVIDVLTWLINFFSLQKQKPICKFGLFVFVTEAGTGNRQTDKRIG